MYLTLQIDDNLLEQLESYRAARRPVPSRSAIVRELLEAALAAQSKPPAQSEARQ